MILHLNSTTAGEVSSEIDRLREQSGSVALGRVLTLVIVVRSEKAVRAALDAADSASRSHPCRIVVIVDEPDVPNRDEAEAQLSAELRVGGDAGLSEIIILRPRGGARNAPESLVMPLLLPDTPMVVWWAAGAPTNPSQTPLGKLAGRRITNSIAIPDPAPVLRQLAENYEPGDTDMAWAGSTIWRGYIAAMLDEPPYEDVTSVEVKGSVAHGSTLLVAAWLALCLGVPTRVVPWVGYGIERVTMTRASGDLTLERKDGAAVASFIRPGRRDQQVRLDMRTDENMLIEELQTLNADDVYGRVLQAFHDGLVEVCED